MSEYKVTYTLDQDSWWVAIAEDLPGVHTQGRTLDEVRERFREALGLAVDDADTALLRESAAVELAPAASGEPFVQLTYGPGLVQSMGLNGTIEQSRLHFTTQSGVVVTNMSIEAEPFRWFVGLSSGVFVGSQGGPALGNVWVGQGSGVVVGKPSVGSPHHPRVELTA